ncbi:MAG: AI-2E family transporter [Parcubacteria group bacterium]|nr:AI-2E family transporter [Parcubacteria group bacterium]
MKTLTRRRVVYDVSVAAIVKVVLVLGVFLVLYQLRSIVVAVFVAILIAAGIKPVVDRLHRRFPVSRSAWAIIIYILVLAFFALSIFLIVPPLAVQITNLARKLPALFSSITSLQELIGDTGLVENLRTLLLNLSSQLSQSASSVLLAIQRIFGSLFSAFTILILSFYMVMEEGSVRRVIRELLPDAQEEYALRLVRRIEEKLGAWVRGQLLLGVIIGIVTYIGLLILGVPFALVLAIIAAFLELIPFLGPIIAAVPAVIVASGIPGTGFTIAILVIALYAIIQQLENQVLVPRIMARAVGLSPVVVIVAFLSGFELFGVLGAILAVPVAAVISILVRDYFAAREET